MLVSLQRRIVVTGYELVIPASFEVDGEEYSVTTIGSENGLNASFPNDKIASVVISEGITRIEACAFYRNKSIVSVSLPNTLTSIGMQAFYNCSVLTKINFPASLTDIDWVDHEGNYVGTGSILKPAEGAMEYLYTITLGEELLLKYHIPAQGSLVSSVNDVIQEDIVLDAIDETTFYGVVVDKLGNPLSDAKIALTQTVNGRKVELEDPSNEGQIVTGNLMDMAYAEQMEVDWSKSGEELLSEMVRWFSTRVDATSLHLMRKDSTVVVSTFLS